MRRSMTWGFAFLLLGSMTIAISGCDSGVGANQNPASLAQTPNSKIGTIEMDCEQLAKLSMQAEVQAMGVQFSWQSNPASLNRNVQELKTSVAQIQSMPIRNPQVEKLRSQYVELLESLGQTVSQSEAARSGQQMSAAVKAKLDQVVNDRVKQAANLRRDRIFFSSCKA